MSWPAAAHRESFYEKQVAFDKTYSAANAAKKKAASVGGEWRDTGKLLKDAKKAADDGDFDTATKLAKEAQDQGERGYAQAISESQKTNLHPSYL